jgi:hypothetical protein
LLTQTPSRVSFLGGGILGKRKEKEKRKRGGKNVRKNRGPEHGETNRKEAKVVI